MKRICAHCKIPKEENEDNFRWIKNPKSKGKVLNSIWSEICRVCTSDYQRKYREKNRERVLAQKRRHYEENKEKLHEKSREWRERNKEYVRSTKRAWKRKYKKENPQYKLRERVSCAIYLALKKNGNGKRGETMERYLPYTMAELKKHIEDQFEPWMSWENHGNYDPSTWDDEDPGTWTWQIDHIVPQSKYNYTSMEDEAFQQCWSLDNLRPLSAKRNVEEQHYR
jgi:hypothetical protein